MSEKFKKTMQNLQDSLDTSMTIDGVEWCHLKRNELALLIGAASMCYLIAPTDLNCQDIVEGLEACADE